MYAILSKQFFFYVLIQECKEQQLQIQQARSLNRLQVIKIVQKLSWRSDITTILL